MVILQLGNKEESQGRTISQLEAHTDTRTLSPFKFLTRLFPKLLNSCLASLLEKRKWKMGAMAEAIGSACCRSRLSAQAMLEDRSQERLHLVSGRLILLLQGRNDGKPMVFGDFLQVCVFKCITRFDGKCSKRAVFLQLLGPYSRLSPLDVVTLVVI